MLYQNHKEIIISDNLRIKSVMFEVTTSVTNLCDSIADNEGLQTLIATQYDSVSDSRKALQDFTLLRTFYERHTEVASITLFTDNHTLYTYEHIRVIDESNQNWFETSFAIPGYFWSTLSSVNQMNIPYQELQLVHPISINNSDYSAILVITISNNYLKNRVSNNNLEVDLAVNDDSVFYSSWGNEDQSIDFNDYHQQSFYFYSGVTEYMGVKTLLEVSTIRPIKAADSIYVFSNNPDAIPSINNIMYVNLLIVIISILIPLVVIISFTKQFSKRILTLKTQMHRVSMGDYDIIDTFKGNDELAELFVNLQNMIQAIKLKNQAIYESELKEQKFILHSQKMELDLLSSKINPHFLYNTLETIRMKAVSSQDVEVAKAIQMLGRYMRYNLESTGNLTTLASEIFYINLYLNIQNLRFANRIKHRITIDPILNLDAIQTLPLLIQPIVENAFNHGLSETTEKGKIDVNILDKGTHVQIQVIDNGKGIGPHELALLRNKFSDYDETERTSFGLYNIHHRLRLFYGDTYGLEIISETHKGTTVQFDIPK
jgi:two-component system sensor histidine kinase YesM